MTTVRPSRKKFLEVEHKFFFALWAVGPYIYIELVVLKGADHASPPSEAQLLYNFPQPFKQNSYQP